MQKYSVQVPSWQLDISSLLQGSSASIHVHVCSSIHMLHIPMPSSLVTCYLRQLFLLYYIGTYTHTCRQPLEWPMGTCRPLEYV